MKIMLSKALVLAVIILFVGAGVVPVFVVEAQFEDYDSSNEIISNKINPMYNQPSTICKQNNILISSDNTEDDMNPKITKNKDTIVVAYEKIEAGLEQTIQIAYTKDEGQLWVPKFTFNSADFFDGSGVLQSPDIKYAPETDEFFLTMVDPLVERNGFHLVWIPDDIAKSDNVTYWRVFNRNPHGAVYVGNMKSAACSFVDKWLLGSLTEDYQLEGPQNIFFEQTIVIAYLYHDKNTDKILWPSDYNSEWIPDGGGWASYYDSQNFLETAPSCNLEMATGSNRVCLVTEHYNASSDKYQIVFKSTVTDIELLLGTIRGGPMGMDKYADIEVWPWQQYLLEGIDPDISANGSDVYVVCSSQNIVGDNDIICAYSSDNGDNWNYSFVSNESNYDEMYPAVYATDTDVYCCYVKSGNLYLVVSKDKGVTWSEPFQINGNDGCVVEEPGTVDLLDTGVVWTDSRNGNKDIFFNEIGPNMDISFSGGFGLKIEICNYGDIPLTLINWSVTIDGALIFIGKDQSGYISEIPLGECATIENMMIMGIGPINITIQIGDITESASGFILGPFVIL